jgi:DNA mismatch endonuclease (patch repair protein)
MDSISPRRRSENMRRIRSKGMAPELAVRRLVFSMGFRYRLHVSGLPGKPDLVFSRHKKVIFVHGCFWHNHQSKNCGIARMPRSNVAYWRPKLAANRLRDATHLADLRKLGWNSLTIWECELEDRAQVSKKIRRFLRTK